MGRREDLARILDTRFHRVYRCRVSPDAVSGTALLHDAVPLAPDTLHGCLWCDSGEGRGKRKRRWIQERERREMVEVGMGRDRMERVRECRDDRRVAATFEWEG